MLAKKDIRKILNDQGLVNILEAGDFSGLTWDPDYLVFHGRNTDRCWHRVNGIEMAQANLKLGIDTLIFNMGPGFRCASAALGLCKVVGCCYNRKGERRASVRRYRLRQEIMWKLRPASAYVDALRAVKARDSRVKYVRFNESADLWSAECLEKLSEISDGVRKSRLLVYGFTARIDLVRGVRELPFKVRLSGYDHDVFPSTRVIENRAECPSGWVVCPNNCRKCRICKHTDLSVCFMKH